MKLTALLIAGVCVTWSTWAQETAGVLSTTRSIADKIINETVFDYRLTPLSFNGGITQFTTEQYQPDDEGAICYAFCKMYSEKDESGRLGISFKGRIKVFLNGQEIFDGRSDSVEIREYTYNRYDFQHKVSVKWRSGINELLVKCACTSGPLSVLLLPQERDDSKSPYVSALPVTDETPNTYWVTAGTWHSASGDAMKEIFPPERGIKEYYNLEDGIAGWKLGEVPFLRELIIPETNSYLRDAYADWHYANGGTMLGILSLHEVTGDSKYLDFVKHYAANLWENDAYFRWQYGTLHAMRGSFHRIHRMTMLDDSGGPALPIAQLQLIDPGYPGYLPLLDRVFDYVVNGQERLPDSTFCRPEPEPATVWADDLFMAVPFLLRMAGIRNEPALYDEAVRQVIRFNRYLSDPESGLYFHGWYNKRKENTPVRWGRANGWIIWATAEALMRLPGNHPGYKTVLKIFRNHMEAVATYQDTSGMWHQVLDHPETFEETSCTAMFTLGLARGVRMGWLKKDYRANALHGWSALQSKIEADGTVKDICRGTGIGENVEFYETRSRFDHDPRGLGAMITAGCEINLLLNQKIP